MIPTLLQNNLSFTATPYWGQAVAARRLSHVLLSGTYATNIANVYQGRK